MNPKDAYREFMTLLRRLDKARIHYELRRHSDDAIQIFADVPGERWEIEFVDYGDEVHIEIERFRSDGVISDESVVGELFKHASAGPESAEEAQVPHDAAP